MGWLGAELHDCNSVALDRVLGCIENDWESSEFQTVILVDLFNNFLQGNLCLKTSEEWAYCPTNRKI